MKKRWLLVLMAAIMLLVFPAVSLAGGGAINEALLEGETTPAVTPTPPAPTPTILPINLPASMKAVLGGNTSLPIDNYAPRELTFTVNTQIFFVEPNNGYLVSDDIEGTATVRATVKGTDYSETCVVTVARVHANRLWLEGCPTEMKLGDSGCISPRYEPYYADYGEGINFSWSSSDTSVITIKPDETENNGIWFYAVGVGTATITVRGDGLSASFTITVTGAGASPGVTTTPLTAPSVTPRPSSSNSVAVTTPAPTRGTEESAYDDPQPTRVPIELEATDWEAAEQAIAGMESGSLGSIEMPDGTFVPISLLQTLQQTQCALEIDMGDYTCTIDGADLAQIPDDLGSVDIGMTMEKDAKLSAACGGSAYELRFNYHGELPGVFTFRVKAEGSRPGDTIYVYYFNEDAGEFESLVAATVDDEGCVSFGITHCSSYYFTNALIPGAENNFKVAAETAEKSEAARSSDNFVAFWVCIYVLGSGVVIAAFVLIFRRRGKRRDAGQQRI